MAVTFQTTYKETLKSDTVELIDELLEDNHDLQCMLTFIDEYNEDDFCTYYETYVEQGEKVGYEVVEAFIEEEGFCDVEHCEEAYAGTFRDTDDFVEDLIESTGDVVPSYVIVDLQATWDRSLSYDYTAVEDKNTGMMHFFRRYY